MANDDVTALLTRAVNRLALAMEKRLAFEQEQTGLRERIVEQRKAVRGKGAR